MKTSTVTIHNRHAPGRYRMTTQEESRGVDRERGIPRVTASRRPDVIFGIANVFCTGAAVLCCRSQVHSRVDWPALVVGAALGSLATLAGIAYADSGIHSFFLGLAVRTAMKDGFPLSEIKQLIPFFFGVGSRYVHCQWRLHRKGRCGNDFTVAIPLKSHAFCHVNFEDTSNPKMVSSFCHGSNTESHHVCWLLWPSPGDFAHGVCHISVGRRSS